MARLHADGSGLRLCAIDFAAARLIPRTISEFPVAANPTVCLGRELRAKHPFHQASALEMLDRIAAVPVDTVGSFLGRLPEGWIPAGQNEGICDFWAGKQIRDRLQVLRAGLIDESLL